MNTFWTPIYYKDGNLFVITSTAFTAWTEAQAQALGERYAQAVEQLLDAEYTGEAFEVCGKQAYVKATLRNTPVAVLSGPVFRKAAIKAATKLAA